MGFGDCEIAVQSRELQCRHVARKGIGPAPMATRGAAGIITAIFNSKHTTSQRLKENVSCISQGHYGPGPIALTLLTLHRECLNDVLPGLYSTTDSLTMQTASMLPCAPAASSEDNVPRINTFLSSFIARMLVAGKLRRPGSSSSIGRAEQVGIYNGAPYRLSTRRLQAGERTGANGDLGPILERSPTEVPEVHTLHGLAIDY